MVLVSRRWLPRAGSICRARIKDAVNWPHSGQVVCIFTWVTWAPRKVARLEYFLKGLACLPRGKLDHFALLTRVEG